MFGRNEFFHCVCACARVHRFPCSIVSMHDANVFRFCEGVGDVVGVEAPLGGVAQVIFHGVQVVEVGVQVRVHQDRGVEEDGEGQVEVEREIGEDQREQHMCNMRMT